MLRLFQPRHFQLLRMLWYAYLLPVLAKYVVQPELTWGWWSKRQSWWEKKMVHQLPVVIMEQWSMLRNQFSRVLGVIYCCQYLGTLRVSGGLIRRNTTCTSAVPHNPCRPIVSKLGRSTRKILKLPNVRFYPIHSAHLIPKFSNEMNLPETLGIFHAMT